jgi:hypothetical protein
MKSQQTAHVSSLFFEFNKQKQEGNTPFVNETPNSVPL